MNSEAVIFHFVENESQRLDKFLVHCFPEYSRSRLQSLIKKGCVFINGQVALKSGQLLERPVLVEVLLPPPASSELVPEEIPLDVIYENEDLLVVNKPAGMVVHPAAGHTSGTLVHAVLAHAPDIEGVGGEIRPGVVHRLDKNTSGLIILAKNDRAHHWLQEQFRTRKVEKVYLALVDGTPPTPNGRIETAIGRDTSQRSLMAVVVPHKGKQAVTEYKTLERFRDHTLLEVHPWTGRTHQIRLHLRFIGCPVAGDTIYGRKHATIPLDRHFLHAIRLGIKFPGENQVSTFEAPLPVELIRLLEQLRNEV